LYPVHKILMDINYVVQAPKRKTDEALPLMKNNRITHIVCFVVS
jgi:hypothetical protein